MRSSFGVAVAAAFALAACSNSSGADAGAPCGSGCPLHEICVSGSCQCISGWLPCKVDGGQVCIDVLADDANCGACGQHCPAAEACLNGTCACVPPSVLCGDGGLCSNLQTDPVNCGACGLACLPNEQCVGALCTCPGSYTLCGLPDGGQVCANLSIDSNNCGACASECDGGTCVCNQLTQTCAPSVPGGPGACVCDATYQGCGPNGTDCVDTGTDPQNCGGCGKVCPTGVCVSGVCKCESPYTECTSTGVCADLDTDPHNCGQCNNDCTLLGVSGAGCQNGNCTCPLDGGPGNVCASGGSPACVDVSTDPQNCGGCNKPCDAPTTACASGQCTCPGQEQLCGSGTSATCVSFTSDPSNCGSCGNVCSTSYAASAVCNLGTCGCTDVQELCISQQSPLSCTCEPASGSGACVQPNVTFAEVAPILASSASPLGCATSGCHSAAKKAGGLDLSTEAAAFAGLMGSPDGGAKGGSCDGGPNGAFGNIPSTACPCTARVAPGSPLNSYLIQVVRDSAFCAAGQPMPIDADGGVVALPACEVELLTTWVSQGAVGP
jgi:hypothetical protein